MKPSERELLEIAALWAVGALDEPTTAAFRWRLESSGDAIRDEAAALLETSALLAESAPPVVPPSSLKERLLGRIENAEQRPAAVLLDEAGVKISCTEEIPWQPHAVPGVAFKPLHVDRESGRLTSLVRFDPGTIYPAHAHARDEELLLLSGDLEIQGRRMGPGDYCRAEAGSTHQSGVTESGALLLVRNSAADRVL